MAIPIVSPGRVPCGNFDHSYSPKKGCAQDCADCGGAKTYRSKHPTSDLFLEEREPSCPETGLPFLVADANF